MAQVTIEVPTTHDYMVLLVPKTHTPIFLEAIAAEHWMPNWQTATTAQRLAFFKTIISNFVENTAIAHESAKAAEAARATKYAEVEPLARGAVTFL